MAEDLSNYRKSYEQNSLSLEQSEENPVKQFKNWFQEVEKSKSVGEVNAMTVSTIGIDGFPKSRIVLLKQYDEKGFIFYTNYESEKGKAIEANPHVCLSFFWPNLERQVIIKGVTSKVDQRRSEEYFHSRPHGSQLGALVSPQSNVIPDREFLEKRLEDLEGKYQDKTVPKPEYWGGFLVKPQEFEFWQGRPNRLHDRIRYTLSDGDWQRDLLAP
ncbi:MAG: pyridoxamine 5'-phosphate oxidase [Leeuwenhoekiella sp.]